MSNISWHIYLHRCIHLCRYMILNMHKYLCINLHIFEQRLSDKALCGGKTGEVGQQRMPKPV
jgi:hypothetical protein